jgi:hypothetical protein
VKRFTYALFVINIDLSMQRLTPMGRPVHGTKLLVELAADSQTQFCVHIPSQLLLQHLVVHLTHKHPHM